MVGWVNKPITVDDLKSRVVLVDPDNVLDIWDYQKILDQLCRDPMIPTDILQLAFDNGAFEPSSVLNLDLRKEGEEILVKRNEASAKRASGIGVSNGFPQARQPNTASSPLLNAMRQQATTNISSPVITRVEPKNVATNDIITETPKLDATENTTASATMEEQMAQKLTPEELVEYKEMLDLSAKGKPLSPAQIAKYITFTQKVNS